MPKPHVDVAGRRRSAGPAARPRAGRSRGDPRKLPSYHFYIVLALFDVAVIVAGIIAQHRTLRSFNEALADVQVIHQRHRWLTDLGEVVIQLNAPGNNIFASRDPEHERRVFRRARIELMNELDSPPRNTPAPPGYSKYVDEMTDAEETIFTLFEHIRDAGDDVARMRELEAGANEIMPRMDRAQANALAALNGETLRLLDDQRVALARHEVVLNERTRIEFLFVLIVALILAGVTWYWRQLQRMADTLAREQERADTEHRNRLAAVGEVCFSVAHGIRNPVAAIAGSAQLVMEYGRIDERSRERVRDVVTACRNLTQRVSELLSFAREGQTRREPCSARELLDQAVEEIRTRLDERGIRVRREYDAVDDLIDGDRHLLVQAAIEMLSNAMDHLRPGGTVTLVCRRADDDPGWIEFGVVDDGPGMSDEIKARACELFFSRKEGGSGIGLASIRRAAELHDGEVVLADAPPHGADVRIRVPAR